MLKNTYIGMLKAGSHDTSLYMNNKENSEGQL